MIKTLAISKRIILQFLHDRRTLLLLFVAPLIVLWLLSVLLGANSYEPKIAVVNLPEAYENELKEEDAIIIKANRAKAESLLERDEIDGILSIKENTTTLDIYLEGGNNTHNSAVIKVVSEANSDYSAACRTKMQKDIEEKKKEAERLKKEAEARQQEIKTKVQDLKEEAQSARASAKASQKKAMNELQKSVKTLTPEDRLIMAEALKKFAGTMKSANGVNLGSKMDSIDIDSMNIESYNVDFDVNIDDYMPVQSIEKSYLHGNEEWELFDFYGPIFIGLFIFVFTFLTSGMSLVNERSAGTMERFLALPVNSVQILGGYVIGFGFFALIQSIGVLAIALRFIGFPCEGNVGAAVFTAVSLAIASVTFGLMVSGLAKTAFQVIQLMILFVVPQILLCGIFDLSGAPGWLQTLADYLPVKYGVDALQQIMLRGRGMDGIWENLLVVWAFIGAFFVLAAIGLRKKKAKRLKSSRAF